VSDLVFGFFWSLASMRSAGGERLEDGNGDAASIDRAEKLTASLFRSPNLGGTRPTGLCFSADRGLLAAATKPGTVYLISLRSRLESENGPPKDHIATSAGPTRR